MSSTNRDVSGLSHHVVFVLKPDVPNLKVSGANNRIRLSFVPNAAISAYGIRILTPVENQSPVSADTYILLFISKVAFL